MPRPFFTVFTPTYNRAHTLHRVFDSLRAQTLRDFEWLVVDDGSTDNTETLIEDWARTADFPIRYFTQSHSGKHFAHNRALKEARGFFLAPIDSDDALAANALERIEQIWNSIPADMRPSFSSVRGLCRDQHGNVIGDRYPLDVLDSDRREQVYHHRLRGEKWGVIRTDIAKEYPFPEISGTQFVPEGVVWMDIAKRFKHRAVNEVFRVYYVNDVEVGNVLSRRANLGDNAAGRLYYYVWLLNNDIEFFFRRPMPFLKAAMMLPIVASYLSRSIWQPWNELTNALARCLVLAIYPLSMLVYFFDRIRTTLLIKRRAGQRVQGNDV